MNFQHVIILFTCLTPKLFDVVNLSPAAFGTCCTCKELHLLADEAQSGTDSKENEPEWSKYETLFK
jgi:hypothetical protein